MSILSGNVDKATRNNETPEVMVKSTGKPRKVQFDFSMQVVHQKWECCKCSTTNDFGTENDFNGNLLPEWCRHETCWHGRCGWCCYVGKSSRHHCNEVVSRKPKCKKGNEGAYMFPLKPDPIEARMSSISDTTDHLRKATVEVPKLESTMNTRVETWISGNTPTTHIDTTTIDKVMSPRRIERPNEKPKIEAKDKRIELIESLQKKKKKKKQQQPSSENIFVVLAKSAFPAILSKGPAKSIKFDKSSKLEIKTKNPTEGKQASEKILFALEKSKERMEARKKEKGKDRA